MSMSQQNGQPISTGKPTVQPPAKNCCADLAKLQKTIEALASRVKALESNVASE